MRISSLFCLFILCATVAAPAQKFTVITVKGAVYANGKPLKKKDKITGETPLQFGSSDAMAYVMSPGKGYFILGVHSKKRASQSDLTMFVKDALIPPVQYYSTSTKFIPQKVIKFQDLKAIEEYFSDGILLIHQAVYAVNAQNIPLDDQHSFSVSYVDDSGETKSLALRHENRKFFLDADQFVENGKEFNAEVTLHYQSDNPEHRLDRARFTLIIKPKKLILDELKNLKKGIPDTTVEEFYANHARLYLNTMYGKHQPDEIIPLLEQL